MATAGFYRRVLPSPPAIDFASTEGKQLFVEAIQNGTMEGFYRLISYFQTQSEPAYCGLASLSMVLNALAIDPGRKWKGPWRWFDESMLDCCEPLEAVKAKGITFGKLVCLAQCAGAKVEAYRTSQSTIEDFRRQVIRCSSSEDCHVISSYHRGAFKQTGTGHFSPIGGYHAGTDMALILDVARFKYPPHWVPLTLLWQAMDNVDEATGQRRGTIGKSITNYFFPGRDYSVVACNNLKGWFMLVSRPHAEPGLLYTLSCKHESWLGIAKFLMDDIPILLRSEDVKNIDQVISTILTSMPSNFGEFIKWVVEVRTQEDGVGSVSQEEKGRLALKLKFEVSNLRQEGVLKQVNQTVLFKHVVTFLASAKSHCRNIPSLGQEKNLPDIAASICCQGAEILAGNAVSSENYRCRETCIRFLKTNGDSHVTLVSGTVTSGSAEQGLDVLIPLSEKEASCCSCGPNDCIGRHPASSDVLTALLLALPPESWSGIKDVKLLTDMFAVVSTDSLPVLLREEVLHLRRQLHLLKRCQENKIDADLGAPLI